MIVTKIPLIVKFHRICLNAKAQRCKEAKAVHWLFLASLSLCVFALKVYRIG
jgi:hypothetical protein